MQERILTECEWLMEKFEELAKVGPIAPMGLMNRTVASVINVVIFGYRFDEDSVHHFNLIQETMDLQNKVLGNPACTITFKSEWMRNNIPWVRNKFALLMKYRDTIYQYFYDMIEEHKKCADFEAEECSDYLKEMYKRRNEEDSTFSDQQFVSVCVDLWIAGMETTASTMAWGILAMLHYPAALKRLHEELDDVIGDVNQLITLPDKSRLPYCQAFMMEVQRWANIIPQNLMRLTSESTVVDGHRVEAGTRIVPQISTFLYDEKVFPNPTSFYPSRFLDEHNNIIQYKHFVPFSIGKRQCLGEGLAKMELFLFSANIANRFDITPNDPSKLPELKRTFSFAFKPVEFDCRFIRRT
ncbi:hypothetical protein PENTCL1PPCAC_28077, partial [Pristionchus entomophagus]